MPQIWLGLMSFAIAVVFLALWFRRNPVVAARFLIVCLATVAVCDGLGFAQPSAAKIRSSAVAVAMGVA